jgi:putative serine protease PepD
VIGARIETYRGGGGGVRLRSVDPGGPAERAGLRSGDVVTRLGRHAVVEVDELIALVRSRDPGTPVTITFRRAGATRTASVTLAADAE